MTTSQLTSISPGPNGWIDGARRALDDLSATRTLPEVEARFGSARRLAELVLGFPISGGHATRRAIRAVGGLLHHRLGPAIAAEALTWSASLAGAVDTATIEAFLEFTVGSIGTYRPWPLDSGPVLLEGVQSFSRSAIRAQALCDLWSRSRSTLLDPEPDYRHDLKPFRVEAWEEGPDDLAHWLRENTFDCGPTVLADQSPEDQKEFVEAASTGEIERLARFEGLFGMDTSVVATCLLQATRSTLSNTSCPPELQNRVRHPYDLATLELALRAGPDCFEQSRVRRMLAELDARHWQALVAAAPTQILETLRGLGLISVDELLTGRLRQVDLEDQRICRAVFGPSMASPTIGLVSEVALRHPQGETLTWILDDLPRGDLPPDAARRLIESGPPRMARAAMRHLPLDRLIPSDKEYAGLCGDAWVAACPGLTASERPVLPWDRLDGWPSPSPPAAVRIWYPEQLRQLELAHFERAPGWRVTLPRRIGDVLHNAKVMRNCTADLIDDVLEGSVFLVIVHDPGGHRYNVAVTGNRGRFSVGHINSWANGGIEPVWIRSAFTRQLNEPETFPEWENQVSRGRPPTTRRERRRSRARAARRRKGN